MTETVQTDVLVLGAGPAGSTCACLTAEAGWSTLVLERDTFPRYHIGESLIPAVIPILKRLGVKAALDQQGYLRKRGTTFRWGRDPEPWTVHFMEGNPRLGYSYQVWREDFDQLLADRAVAKGATVRFGHRVRRIILDDAGRAVGAHATGPDGVPVEVRARYVVDATGQDALTGRQLDTRRWDGQLRHVAIYGYFRDADTLPGIDATNTLTEGYDEGWVWHIPLHTGLTSVGTVVRAEDPDLQRLDPASLLLERIGRTHTVRELTSRAQLVKGPYSRRDWSYSTDRANRPGLLMVGDAARFIDPLFSTGVYLAMQSALTAAACLNSILSGEVGEKEAFDFFDRDYADDYSDLREIVTIMYASVHRPKESVFWNAHRILAMPDSVSARRAFVRLISGRERLGFKFNPLEPLDLDPELRTAMESLQDELRANIPMLRSLASAPEQHPFFSAVLRPAAEAQYVPSLIVINDEWTEEAVRLAPGYCVRTPRDPRGHPKDRAAVDALLPLFDGRNTVRQVVDELTAGELTWATSVRQVVDIIANLYWHGGLEPVPPEETGR